MELFDVIRDIGILNTYDSKFYIGTMILVFEYLHSLNIVFLTNLTNLTNLTKIIDLSGLEA